MPSSRGTITVSCTNSVVPLAVCPFALFITSTLASVPGKGHRTVQTLADIDDPRPTADSRITTSVGLRPQDHRALAQAALDSGIKQQSLIRRALVAVGIIALTATEAEAK